MREQEVKLQRKKREGGKRSSLLTGCAVYMYMSRCMFLCVCLCVCGVFDVCMCVCMHVHMIVQGGEDALSL